MMSKDSFARLEHRLILQRSIANRQFSNTEYQNDSEVEWCVSRFLFSLLKRAELSPKHLTFYKAISILESNKVLCSLECYTDARTLLNSLVSKNYARVVMQDVHLPYLVRSSLRSEPEVDLSINRIERVALNVLASCEYPDVWYPTIPESVFAEVLDQHREVFDRTPATELVKNDCCGSSSAEDSGNLYLKLSLASSSFGQTSVAKAAALLWEYLLIQEPETAPASVLKGWCRLVLYSRHSFNAPRYMTKHGREKFLDGCFYCAINDKDVINSPVREIQKIHLEHRWIYQMPANAFPSEELSQCQRLESWSNVFNLDLTLGKLLHNAVREPLINLLRFIVQFENPVRKQGLVSYKRTEELVKKTGECPYISYSLPSMLSEVRPELLPTLLLNSETCSLGAKLLSDVKISTDMINGTYSDGKEEREELLNLWLDTVKIIETSLPRFDKKNQANIFVELIRPIAQSINKFIHHSQYNKKYKLELEKRRLQTTVSILLNYFSRGGATELQIVLQKVVELLNSMELERDRNNTYQFSQEMLICLLSLIDWYVCEYRGSGEERLIEPFKQMCKRILKDYRSEFERDYYTDSDGEVKPVEWYDDVEHLISLQWASYAFLMSGLGWLRDLTNPTNLNIGHEESIGKIKDKAAESASKYMLRISWINKSRFLLRILLKVYSSLNGISSGKNNDRIPWCDKRADAREIVEDEIIGLVKGYDVSDSDDHIEPLDDSIESGALDSLSKELVSAMNSFTESKQRRFVEAFIPQTHSIVCLYEIGKSSTNTEAVSNAQKAIANIIETPNWDKNLIFHKQLEIAKLAILSGVPGVVPKLMKKLSPVIGNSDYAKSYWFAEFTRLKIIDAYISEDFTYLRQSSESIAKHDGDYELAKEHAAEIDHTHRFYLGLLKIDEDPEKAKIIFDKLLKEVPNSPSLIVNSFAAELRAANDKEILASTNRYVFLDILNKWDRIINDLSAYQATQLGDGIIYNRLYAMSKAHSDVLFDRAIQELSDNVLFSKDICLLVVSNLERRKSIEGLSEYYSRIEYYYDRTGKVPGFVDECRSSDSFETAYLVNGGLQINDVDSTISQYQIVYPQILDLPAPDLVKVIGGLRTNNLANYILLHHIRAAREILGRSSSLESSVLENRLNDIFVSFLRMRFSHIGWSVGPSPGGKSESGNCSAHGGVGERDWVIRSKEGDELSITEAMRIMNDSKDTPNVEVHIKKLVDKYDPIGLDHAIVVAYYKGKKFKVFVKWYIEFVQKIKTNSCGCAFGYHSIEEHSKGELKVFSTKYKCEFREMTMYHLILDLSENSRGSHEEFVAQK
ncbi:MAG: hypothetical protein KAH31_04980 [Candidatus Sabulitectum sp.]|nr:hypothetical protein [Candidatus Sabulitectum sp.]